MRSNLIAIIAQMAVAAALLAWTSRYFNRQIKAAVEAHGESAWAVRAFRWGKRILTAIFITMITAGVVSIFVVTHTI